jgi:hypothetical protein
MTQDEVEEKIYSHAKKKNIKFDYKEMVSEISKHITALKTTEECQDVLNHLISLFNGIWKYKRGKLLHDERNGKVVCIQIKSDIKKYMALHFETHQGKITKSYNIYFFEISALNKII